MRLLFLNYEYPPLGGGAATATYYLLQQLSEKFQVKTDLVTSTIGPARIERPYRNTTIHFLNIGKKNGSHHQTICDLIRYSINAFFYAKKLCRRGKYDVALAFFGIPCGVIAEKLSLPYVISLRGSDIPYYNNRYKLLDKFFFSRLSHRAWRRAQKIIAVSEYLAKLAQKQLPELKIEVIYNGVDCQKFFPKTRKRLINENFNILYVGRLSPIKGLDYLLESFKTLSTINHLFHLTIAGSGPSFNKIYTYIEKNNLKQRVTLLGKVSHEALAEYYRQAHVYVQPSIKEALANTVLEAEASGLPIITTATGPAELIKGNGFIVQAKKPQEITDAIKKLFGDERKRMEMANLSRQIAQQYSWNAMAAKYYALLKQVVNSYDQLA